jgi:hypothetical protein
MRSGNGQRSPYRIGGDIEGTEYTRKCHKQCGTISEVMYMA